MPNDSVIEAIADPREFPRPDAASDDARALHRLAEASLGADTGVTAAARDAEIAERIAALLGAGDGDALDATMASAPSAAVYRHLWRAIVAEVERGRGDAVAPTLFAIPVIVVAASDDDREHRLDAVVEAPAELERILAEHGALSGNRQFALAGALAAAEAIELRALPRLMKAAASPEGAPLDVAPSPVVAMPGGEREHLRILAEHGALSGNRQFALAGALAAAEAIELRALPRLMKAAASPEGAPLDVAPSPVVAMPGGERVHLRFLVGSALAASPAALLGRDDVGRWGVPFTRALSRAIAAPGVSAVALPRAPQSLPAAVATGRLVSREAAATLFASNALRRMRASVGEPIATISAHRADGVRTRGELRVSLSSPLDSREAEGFRCPLEPLDRVADIATMLADVLAECRVADVRWRPGVHADRDPATGLPLLFKADDTGPTH